MAILVGMDGSVVGESGAGGAPDLVALRVRRRGRGPGVAGILLRVTLATVGVLAAGEVLGSPAQDDRGESKAVEPVDAGNASPRR